MSKHLLLASILTSSALLAACASQTAPTPVPSDNTTAPSTDQEESEPSQADDTNDAADATPRVIDMTVTDWAFSQKEIRVKKGEKVTIRVSGVEGDHSFMSSDLGINVAVAPGETKEFEIPTDNTGTFGFRCGIPCGEGHRDMTGQVIIE